MPVGPRRAFILDPILPRVVPSREGDSRWKLLSTTKQTVGTSCALLPRFVAKEPGVHDQDAADGLLDYGLATMRNAALKQNAWRHCQPGSDRRPRPGDFYMLCTGGELDGVGGRPMRFLCGWLDVDNYPFVNH